MANKDYVGNGITVHWEPAICEHSERCFRSLPAAFDPKARPWIDAQAASADEIAAVVDACPSRALTYTRTDGAPMGSNGVAATPIVAVGRNGDENGAAGARHTGEPVTVEHRRNGPLVLTGELDVRDADGTLQHLDQAFLCRCGGSDAKPFCDGTHKRIGFEADGVEPVSRRR
jgi:uncharacterized Fe-S cluster protein YjdI/CDGSH-type Zn-finger protein